MARPAPPTVAVVVPARDEAATVGDVVASLLDEPLVTEVVVADDGSTDGTATVAASAGARVVAVPAGPAGKGTAIRAGLSATAAEIVVFCDADLRSPAGPFARALVAPLLADPAILLVKGRYRRSLDGRPDEGGRLTALLARPLLAALAPDLAHVEQPLGGETAARRSLRDALELEPGYGVEVGLLLDAAALAGAGAIAQVDLGARVHRNRPLAELEPMAGEVLRAVLRRRGHPDA